MVVLVDPSKNHLNLSKLKDLHWGLLLKADSTICTILIQYPRLKFVMSANTSKGHSLYALLKDPALKIIIFNNCQKYRFGFEP